METIAYEIQYEQEIQYGQMGAYYICTTIRRFTPEEKTKFWRVHRELKAHDMVYDMCVNRVILVDGAVQKREKLVQVKN